MLVDSLSRVPRAVLEAVGQAIGREPRSDEIVLRPPDTHQRNRNYDVWLEGGEHHIAKEYLLASKPDSAWKEYQALRIVEPLDIAPRPLFFDPAVGPVVVYAFLEGAMWDRRKPGPAELETLADVWIRLHDVPPDGKWMATGQARAWDDVLADLHAPIAAYAAWARQNKQAQREAARLCLGM